jgi:putative ABC transport system permease protein
VRLVLGQGLVLAGLGVGIGAAASTLTVRAVRTLVYDISLYDPWTFAIGAGLLVVVSVVASYLPALRASRVDPLVALRAE